MRSVGLYMCGGETPVSQIPLGIGYLMAFCGGNSVNIDNMSRDEFASEMVIGRYDVIGFSATASGLREASDLAKTVKDANADITTVLGGQAAIWSGCVTLKEFDYIVRGDGEIAMTLIINLNMRKVRHGSPDIIENLRVDDLDMLPPPFRGTLDHRLPIVTSRGCPYNCAFCSSRAQWGEPRYHSVDYVIEDITRGVYQQDQVREIYIIDDLFMHPEHRWVELYEKWMRKGFRKRFYPSGFTRTNLVTPASLRMMKDMGFPYLRIGIESGSNRILQAIGKGVNAEDHQRVIDQAHEIGMPVRGSFIRGVPGETEEDRRLTSEFIEKNKGKLEVMGDYVWKPFPGNGFNYCLAVLRLDSAGRSISNCVLKYNDLLERAHPTDGRFNWGRFQGVSKWYKFKNGKLRPIGRSHKRDRQ